MESAFYSRPILNSPYEDPRRHWALDADGRPTGELKDYRRDVSFVSPIPPPDKQTARTNRAKAGGGGDGLFEQDETTRRLSGEGRQVELADFINRARNQVVAWRRLPPEKWGVTPETRRLLLHWRQFEFSNLKPYFCQVEAVETAIWLTEVAPKFPKLGGEFLDRLALVAEEYNPGLSRLALKMATGAGKTTVMAMLIAWQAVNAARHPGAGFADGFLVVAPGITIRERLSVLLPSDPNSYYRERELVPADMLADVQKAIVVVANYHVFMRREVVEVSKTGRRLLQGRLGGPVQTVETKGQMLRRAVGELFYKKNIVVFNDEAHHCYRVVKDGGGAGDGLGDGSGDGPSEGEDKREYADEVKENNEAARLWVSGLEAVAERMGIRRVFDLSATPFFLRGSGVPEGSLFPWTMSDFSLMDAIECGIVKLPRVPTSDNRIDPGSDMPQNRDLWRLIGKRLPKKGRLEGLDTAILDKSELLPLHGAMMALYGHYEETFDTWKAAGQEVPPCFIIVCNNTSTSKLVYDYVAGRALPDGRVAPGKLRLFRNHDENGNAYPRVRTILIDSRQLESGEAIGDDFRRIYAAELDVFRREALQRGGGLAGDIASGKDIPDAAILREVMNTVGKAGRLGGDVRCVVSVSMLTEGWDASNVTHILGLRAFGTQLLCEQVVGRALRRRSFDLDENGLFSPEYADVFGVPFNFADAPQVVTPAPPADLVRVRALPEKSEWEIAFPRVVGYRAALPRERLRAAFGDDSRLTLSPELVGATVTKNTAIIGEAVNMEAAKGFRQDMRHGALVMLLTKHCLQAKWGTQDGGQHPYGGGPQHLYGRLKGIVEEWIDGHLECIGGTTPAMLQYEPLAKNAAERIHAAIMSAAAMDAKDAKDGRGAGGGLCPVAVDMDPYCPRGTTADIDFQTSKKDRWHTKKLCHLNIVVCDQEWERSACRFFEEDGPDDHPRVLAYVKNFRLGFEVPYSYNGELRHYRPDFIVCLDDGRAPGDPLNLVLEMKGQRDDGDAAKKSAMENYWVPSVNALGTFGRWAFCEVLDPYRLGDALCAAAGGAH